MSFKQPETKLGRVTRDASLATIAGIATLGFSPDNAKAGVQGVGIPGVSVRDGEDSNCTSAYVWYDSSGTGPIVVDGVGINPGRGRDAGFYDANGNGYVTVTHHETGVTGSVSVKRPSYCNTPPTTEPPTTTEPTPTTEPPVTTQPSTTTEATTTTATPTTQKPTTTQAPTPTTQKPVATTQKPTPTTRVEATTTTTLPATTTEAAPTTTVVETTTSTLQPDQDTNGTSVIPPFGAERIPEISTTTEPTPEDPTDTPPSSDALGAPNTDSLEAYTEVSGSEAEVVATQPETQEIDNTVRNTVAAGIASVIAITGGYLLWTRKPEDDEDTAVVVPFPTRPNPPSDEQQDKAA